MALCRAIIQQGPRKGLTCQNPPSNDYCLHHQRNSEYDRWIQEGKHPCGMFFRGCDQETTEEERAQGYIHCASCRQKKRGKEFPCQAPGCTSMIPTEEQRYCKKHPMYSRCQPSLSGPTIKDRWRALQQDAYEKGLFFMIPFSENLFGQPCVYCGTPSNTIDRTDPTKGYLLSHLLLCCSMCLTMKGTDTPLEFLERIATTPLGERDATEKRREIQSYCDRTRFEEIQVTPLRPYRGRSYSVANIYEIMTNGSYPYFIEWCRENRTPEFLSAMNEIRHGPLSHESLLAIREELEHEPNRKRIPLSEKKTLHASTMYAYLVMGKMEQIREWYTSRYTPSVLYEERLRDLMDRLPTLDPPAGREACQQMMMEENHRRIAQERRDKERRDKERTRERGVLQEVDPFALPAVPIPFDLPEMSEISMTYRSLAILLPEVDPVALPCAP